MRAEAGQLSRALGALVRPLVPGFDGGSCRVREEPRGLWHLLEKVALVAVWPGRGAAAGVEGRGQALRPAPCPLGVGAQRWAMLLRACAGNKRSGGALGRADIEVSGGGEQRGP